MDRKSSNGKGFVDESVSISSSNSSSSNYRQPFGRSVGRSVGEYFASAWSFIKYVGIHVYTQST